MAREFDLIVIGTGTAASAAVARCHEAGWRIAVVDHRPFGGTCAQRGCDPKKVLVGVASAIDRSDRLRAKGAGGAAAMDWSAMMAFKREFTDPVPQMKAEGFAKRGVAAHQAHARFTGPTVLDVNGGTLAGRYVLLAAGAMPMPLGIDGEQHLASSDAFLALEQAPGHLVLVGGGYIAFEFAHIARRAGSEVTLLEQSESVLAPFEPELVAWLVERTRALGIDVRTGVEVKRVAPRPGGRFQVEGQGRAGTATFDADLVVHAAGRIPALEGLDLEAAGVRCEAGRLCLNEYLQSVSNPAVYAAGDVAQQGPPLTPVASRDGDAAARNMLHGNQVKPDYSGVPSVVFTIPPLASVGLTEAAARAENLRFRVNCAQTAGWYSNRRVNEPAAGYKVLLEEGSGRVLGAHLLGPHADEVINVFALAVQRRLVADELKDAVFAYPTGASDISHML